MSDGTRFGFYEIVAPLGAGGMGEVYRAKDTKLGRDVALKILPASFTNDPERVARFRREAQVLASLNHSHIAQIYGLEESNGTQFLVLELVDGESLDKRIARGPIPVDEALGIAKQIAEALEAAHEKGIIHRDLKPANIALTNDGQVKVLDFGLAKAVETTSGSADAMNSPTITSPAMMTGVGVILGTAAYMSPEQAKGRAADKRSDVWAFGCVLYEMLTGKRSFDGEDVSDTLAAVLRGEPDWARIPTEVPPYIRTLVGECLEKNRSARPAEIAVARFVLTHGVTFADPVPQPPVPLPAPSPLRRYAVPIGASVLLTAAIVSAAWWRFKPEVPVRAVTRFTFPLGEHQRFTNAGRPLVGISPDGTQMVYVADSRLYVRAMSELDARPLPGLDLQSPETVTSPVFSPDGRSIAFHFGTGGGETRGTLKTIAVTGGAAVALCPELNPYGMSWDEFGILVGQGREGIIRVSPNGGKPERLITVKDDEVAHGPQLLPDHETVLFTLAKGPMIPERWDHAQIVAQSLKNGKRTTLIDGASDARYLSSGHLVYALGGVLYAVPFDVRQLRITGAPVPIVEGVRRAGAGATGAAQFAVAHNGTLIYIPGPVSTSTRQLVVVRVEPKTGAVDQLHLPPDAYEIPRVSPDGKQVAMGVVNGREADIWVADLAGENSPTKLTHDGRSRFPVWSADSRHVAFQSDRAEGPGIFWQLADGTRPAQRLTSSDPGTSETPESWSPKDDYLLFGSAKGSSISLWTLDLRSRKSAPFGSVASAIPPNSVFSPDGRWVAYAVLEGPRTTLYVQPFPATGLIRQISPDAVHPMWSPKGNELFFATRFGLEVVTITTQPTFVFSRPTRLPLAVAPFRSLSGGGPDVVRPLDMLPDGQHILGTADATQLNATATSQIRIVLNWSEELKQRAPTR
jgi:serine/threonine-protein kinase